MKISPITTSHPQTFNGTVDKSVVNLIDTATKNEIKWITRIANEYPRPLCDREIAKLEGLKKLKNETMGILNSFMEKLHPQTSLKLRKDCFVMENSKINSSLDFSCNGRVSPDLPIDYRIPIYDATDAIRGNKTVINYNNLGESALRQINLMADRLRKYIQPKKVDKALFAQFTSKLEESAKESYFLGDFRAKRNGKKANKLAPEFGAEQKNWVEVLLQARQEIKDKKAKGAEIVKSNKETIKEIFG